MFRRHQSEPHVIPPLTLQLLSAPSRNRTPALRIPAEFPAKLPVGDIGPCLAAGCSGA
ncbi:hypothetical protein K440DRAFT_75339 [Wilcoxina mikolae CBS 423.85]|nr:hypothetical protein K440DRAFT_75339 [Wilcoxina mikolae CBS 423.85]